MNNSDFSYFKITHCHTWKSRQLSPIIAIPNLTHHLKPKQEEIISQEVIQNEQLSERVHRISHLDEDKKRQQIIPISFSLSNTKHFVKTSYYR